MDVRTSIASNGGHWITQFGEQWKKQIELARAQLGDAIEDVLMPPDYPTDVPIYFVKKSRLIEVLKFFKANAEFQYSFLSDVTATDESPEEPRFHIVYNLCAIDRGNMRVRIKTKVAENEECPTATGVWPGANWVEREVFDMYGVRFTGHPDLRRILMDERWQGHPLRKDYPLRGYQLFPTPEAIHPELLDKDGIT